MTTVLKIEQRDEKIKPDVLRTAGKVPAVLYGPKEPTLSITLDRKEFDKVWKASGETTIVDLEGAGETKEALIHQVDFHPVTDIVEHVDFYVVEKGKKVQTNVPLSFVGESPAVKNLGGTLMKIVHEIEVEAFPKDLPREIEIDISKLETFESVIAIKDLQLPATVTILGNPDDTIASVTPPREEEIETPPEAIDMDAIEVEKKGKEEGEEGGETAGETPAPEAK